MDQQDGGQCLVRREAWPYYLVVSHASDLDRSKRSTNNDFITWTRPVTRPVKIGLHS